MINDYRNALRLKIDQLIASKDLRRLIVWDVGADESSDPSLLSKRAYGSAMHIDVVLVACGVNGIWEPLPRKRIVMPSLTDVLALRKKYLGDSNGI